MIVSPLVERLTQLAADSTHRVPSGDTSLRLTGSSFAAVTAPVVCVAVTHCELCVSPSKAVRAPVAAGDRLAVTLRTFAADGRPAAALAPSCDNWITCVNSNLRSSGCLG